MVRDPDEQVALPPLSWETPDGFPPLEAFEVHVWRFGLDAPRDRLDRFEATLNVEERARADRFRGAGLRKKFVAGRGALRSLLGSYLGRDPAEVRFRYGVHGKPTLEDDPGGLSFNLAHSGEIALCAFSRGRSLGVDVEFARPLENGGKIIKRFFSESEQTAFHMLPDTDRLKGFYLGWTRKEAFLKATGTGLATRLDSFDVNLDPSESPRILRVDESSNGSGTWNIYHLDPLSGYAGALVVAATGRDQRLVIRLWDALSGESIF